MGVLYILDEPSIGLHPRDNDRLLLTLRRLAQLGNTVVVVEHDEDTMRAADHLVDFGPGPGVKGGEVVAQGSIDDLARRSEPDRGLSVQARKRYRSHRSAKSLMAGSSQSKAQRRTTSGNRRHISARIVCLCDRCFGLR